MPRKKKIIDSYTDEQYEQAIDEIKDFFDIWTKKHYKEDEHYPSLVYSVFMLDKNFDVKSSWLGSFGNTDEMIEIHAEGVMELRDSAEMQQAEEQAEKLTNQISNSKLLN